MSSYTTDEPIVVTPIICEGPQAEWRYIAGPYRSCSYAFHRDMLEAIVKRFPNARMEGQSTLISQILRGDNTSPMFDAIPPEPASPDTTPVAIKPRAKRSKVQKGI